MARWVECERGGGVPAAGFRGKAPTELVLVSWAHCPLLGLAAVLLTYPRSPALALALQWLVISLQFFVGVVRQDWFTFGVRRADCVQTAVNRGIA